jgi:hypothetical protein
MTLAEIDKLLAKCRERRSRHARALQIATSPDPDDRKRLLVVAEKVAELHPGFARDLLVLVERAGEMDVELEVNPPRHACHRCAAPTSALRASCGKNRPAA